MTTKGGVYYQVYMEVSLKKARRVFGFINISNIPYYKFEEIFEDQMEKERSVFDYSTTYFIDKKLYKKYKDYFTKEIPFTFDFKLFDYAVGISTVEIEKYRKNYYEDLPPFKKNLDD